MRSPKVIVAISFLLQALSVLADIPLFSHGLVTASGMSADPDQTVVPVADTASQDALAFTKVQFLLSHEGHLTLSWNPLVPLDRDTELTYMVVDDDDQRYYQGVFPSAFISGLADGEYRFHLHAVDAEGVRIATSLQPAEIQIRHWPGSYAWALMAIGFTIVGVMVVVIVLGDRQTGDTGNRQERDPVSETAPSQGGSI